jgi:phosphoglycerol transferase MdoB-like AlkP superfamily enzyme
MHAMPAVGNDILCSMALIKSFQNKNAVKYWNAFLSFLLIVCVLFYAIDFYHYDYLHQRLNATVLNYLQDAGISFTMMWQSYPLLKMLFLLMLVALGGKLFFAALLRKYQTEDSVYKRSNILAVIFTFLFFAYTIIGNVYTKPGQYPLRWSDAFTFTNEFKS